jgi:hypothetical protein
MFSFHFHVASSFEHATGHARGIVRRWTILCQSDSDPFSPSADYLRANAQPPPFLQVQPLEPMTGKLQSGKNPGRIDYWRHCRKPVIVQSLSVTEPSLLLRPAPYPPKWLPTSEETIDWSTRWYSLGQSPGAGPSGPRRACR